MHSRTLIQKGRRTTFLTFMAATVLFILYLLISSVHFINSFKYAYLIRDFIIYLGYILLAVAAVINVIVFFRLYNRAYQDRKYKSRLRRTYKFILINIPVIILYFVILSYMWDTMRINFVNATPGLITDIKIRGCKKKYIERLSPGDNKTIYVKVSKDCSIWILYKQNGLYKKEVVLDFISPSLGQEMTYRIGNKKM